MATTACPRCGALGWVLPCSECSYPGRTGWRYSDANGRLLIGPCADLECSYQSLPGGGDHNGPHSYQPWCEACAHEWAEHGLNATDTIRPCRVTDCECPDWLRYDGWPHDYGVYCECPTCAPEDALFHTAMQSGTLADYDAWQTAVSEERNARD